MNVQAVFVDVRVRRHFERIVCACARGNQEPERKAQAASWKILKAAEPGAGGSVLYVFIIDPAVKDADYTVSTILAEGFPAEVNTIFKQYADSFASGQNFVNLTTTLKLGQ